MAIAVRHSERDERQQQRPQRPPRALAEVTLSVIIPTRNEGENCAAIARRIASVLVNCSYEIVFVDDSTDTTVQVLNRLAAEDRHVRYIHRWNERGLGTAVVTGMALARGRYMAVMDCDFQHPAELLPVMLRAMDEGADLVIPSRFIGGGDDQGLV